MTLPALLPHAPTLARSGPPPASPAAGRVPWGLVVGCEPGPVSDAPLRLAAALVGDSAEPVHAVSVLPAVSPILAAGFPALPASALDRLAPSRALRALVARATPAHDGWSTEVRAGPPARALAAVATERDARLLVVGLGLGRLRTGAERGVNLRRIVRHAPVPLLAVAPDADRRPHSAVAGVDFGRTSVAATRAAAALLGERGTLYLVHVRPFPADPGADPPEEVGFPEPLDPWFERLAAALAPAPHLLVRPAVLRGDPAAALLDFAQRVRADLLAVGTQGAVPPGPPYVGHVTGAVLLGARTSVLVVPAD